MEPIHLQATKLNSSGALEFYLIIINDYSLKLYALQFLKETKSNHDIIQAHLNELKLKLKFKIQNNLASTSFFKPDTALWGKILDLAEA